MEMDARAIHFHKWTPVEMAVEWIATLGRTTGAVRRNEISRRFGLIKFLGPATLLGALPILGANRCNTGAARRRPIMQAHTQSCFL